MSSYALVVDGFIYRVGTLVEMLLDARGCGNARVYRGGDDLGWTPVVTNAGSDVGPLVWIGRRGTRTVHRRKARWSGPGDLP